MGYTGQGGVSSALDLSPNGTRSRQYRSSLSGLFGQDAVEQLDHQVIEAPFEKQQLGAFAHQYVNGEMDRRCEEHMGCFKISARPHVSALCCAFESSSAAWTRAGRSSRGSRWACDHCLQADSEGAPPCTRSRGRSYLWNVGPPSGQVQAVTGSSALFERRDPRGHKLNGPGLFASALFARDAPPGCLVCQPARLLSGERVTVWAAWQQNSNPVLDLHRIHPRCSN